MSALIDHVKASTGFSESTITAVWESVVAFMSLTLRNGEKLPLEGLGILKATDRPERQGRNPRTGEAITFKASRRPKLSFSKSFLTLVQPDPSQPQPAPAAESTAQSVVPVAATTPPPIPAELLPQQTLSHPEQTWQIKAPDSSFVEVPTSELAGWGVNASTPVYSPSTGWKLAGKVPELVGIVQ
ncbi:MULTISPECIES: HU family DNA-binding protein [unclassified Microcoleus]|uniref:HU family DNA-binding protein n=1 Tax=unclassified Microcoleus TaxID=2642155 RepID=UPI002FD1C143